MPKTTRDFETKFPDFSPFPPIVIPAGTEVELIENTGGTPPQFYAVKDTALLARLSNEHDATHRYCSVPTELVDEGGEG